MGRWWIMLLAACAFVFPVCAEDPQPQPPELERGFKPELLYQYNGIDSINLFNGNLNATITLGSYPVSADLSYSFDLRYAGNAWALFRDCPPPPNSGPRDPRCTNEWFPRKENAGMGWYLSPSTFGGLSGPNTGIPLWDADDPTDDPPVQYEKAKYAYWSPDGSEHLFYPTLHEPVCSSTTPTECDSKVDDVYYTRDGSYLRVRKTSNATILEFPDGRRQRYGGDDTWIYSTSSTLDANGLPTTNWIRLQWETDMPNDAYPDWLITDSHGRTHRIYFYNAGNTYAGLVDRVELAAPAVAGSVASYNFIYGTESNGADMDGDVPTIPTPNPEEEDVAVYLLRRVKAPEGENWKFVYETGATNHDSPGAMTRLTLPTGGRINWSYQRYTFDTRPTTIDPIPATAVKERCLRRDDDPCSLTNLTDHQDEYTSYTRETSSDSVAVRMYDWTGSRWGIDTLRRHYFWGAPDTSFGLPFTGTPGALNISSEVFDCDPSNDTCSSTSLQKQYVKYEMDAVGPCNVEYPCGRDRNRRVVSERTVFTADADKHADTDRSDFDGLGHYRSVTTKGFTDTDPVRVTYTNYNANVRGWNNGTGGSVGKYELTPTGARKSGYTMLGSGDPWILDTFTLTSTTEGGSTSYREACFNVPKGFLARERINASGSSGRGANDLLRVYTQDPSGYPSLEQHYGGDTQAVSTDTTNLCQLPLPASPEFSITHTYQSGVRKTTLFGNLSWKALNNTGIDNNTGLVTESADPAGFVTKYVYDGLKRLTKVTPPGVTATTYGYFPAVSSSARVEAKTTDGDTDETRVEQQWEFDPYGRIGKEKRLTAANTWAVRKTTYHPLGLRATISEFENETTATYAAATTYGNYDALGRIGKITTPDGKSTTFTYTGSWLTSRSYEIAAGTSADVTVQVQEKSDRNGRLIHVVENADSTAPAVTDYTYDEGNRLATVKIWDGTSHQDRTFDYDLRGLLKSETHPESDTASYTYDSRGNIRTRTTPVATLEYLYDDAGRLTDVKHNGSLLKHFTYDRLDASDTSSSRLGKTVLATRYNTSTELGTAKVEEKFTYGGPGGRLSQKDTTVTKTATGDTVAAFTEQYSYTTKGVLETTTYPSCTGCAFPSRVVTNTYRYGVLSDVSPYTYASSASRGITYHPNGMIDVITHGNVSGTAGPAWKQTLGNQMARPGSITVTNYCDTLSVSAPQSREVASGTPANVSVTFTNATSFQWFLVGASSFEPLIGQNTATLTTLITQPGTYFVRVGNNACTVDSTRVQVTVQGCSPSTVTITSPSTVTASLTADAEVPDGGAGASYQWSINGAGSIESGQGTRQVRIRALCSGTINLSVTVTKNGCPGTGSATMTVNPGVATLSAAPMTTGAGGEVVLSVSLTGIPPFQVRWSDSPTPVTVNAYSLSRSVYPTTTTSYGLDAVKDVNGCSLTIAGSPVPITVQNCTPPDITITAPASIKPFEERIAYVPLPQDSATYSYSWSHGQYGAITSASDLRQITFRSGCNGPVELTVTVTRNGCASSKTRTVPVSLPTATLSVVGNNSPIVQGNSALLQVALTGTSPWTVKRSDNALQPEQIYTSVFQWPVSPTTTTNYTVQVSDSGYCDTTITGSPLTITVVAPPPGPSNVLATAVPPSAPNVSVQVDVTWTFSGTADRFDIYRSDTATRIGTTPVGMLHYSDFSAAPNTAYIYTVKAVKNEIASAAVDDLATTVVFQDDPVVPRLTKVRAVHVAQLQTAVNAVRALAGLAPQSFAAVAVRDRIYASHIQQLRTALAPARSALGLPSVTYARAILEPLMRIWASDVNDTRAGVK